MSISLTKKTINVRNEQGIFDEVGLSESINSAKSAAESAENSAKSAAESAETATNSATQTSQDLTEVKALAESVSEKADTAQTAADTAKQSAESAEKSQSAAETAADSAQKVAESIPEDYSELSGDVNSSIVWTANIFDKSKAKSGYCSNSSKIIENSNFYYTKVKVSGGKTYTSTSTRIGTQFGCVFGANDKVIGAVSSYIDGGVSSWTYPNTYTITLPDDAKYMLINCLVSEIDTYMVVEGAEMPSDYVEYGFEMPLYLNKNSPLEIKLKTDGNGDFTSLKSAVEYAKKMKASKTIIFIYPGEYDVCADFTEDEIANASCYPTVGFVGVEISDGIYLKGVGANTDIILKGEMSTSVAGEKREAISTLNLLGNCGIENLTVTSKYIRYPIHDDFKSNVDTTHVIKDCVFINYANSSNNGRNNGYGLGTRSGSNVIIENCYIEPSMVYHNNTDFSKNDNVRLINTKISGQFNVIDADSGVSGKLEMLNSSCGYMNYSCSGDTQHIAITGVGETNYPITTKSDTVYTTGNTIVKRVWWGCSTGQCVCEIGADGQTKLGFDVVARRNSAKYIYGIALSSATHNNESIIQICGYISANNLGNTNTTGWVRGTLLKVGDDSYLTETEDKTEAVAVVALIVDDTPFIRLIN